jgi:predicted MFS family arabinose efflux permease
MIIVATVALGIAFGYDMPAYQALLPDLVPPEKITQVVALNSSTFHGSRMVGPAIAGAVIGAWGLATAYFLNAASFLAVIFSLAIIRYRPAPRDDGPQGTAIDGLKEGLRHARGRPNLQVLLWLTALNVTFLFPSMAILSPYYVTNVLDEGATTLGLFWGMSGLGSLIGALALMWWPTQARSQRIWAGALLGPLAMIVMAITREPLVALAMAGVTSISFSSQLNIVQSMIQESTPREFRGRVMSLHGITFNGTMPIAGLVSAGAAVAVGLPAVMVVSAVAFVIGAVVLLLFVNGGIENVVSGSREEFEVIAAGSG